MVVLHIATIRNNPCDGICVAVPQHIRAQAQWASVGFCNVWEERIHGLEDLQLPFAAPFQLEALPGDFSEPDLVVFHDVYRPPFLTISRQLRKKRIPYVIIPHGCLRREAQRKKWLKKKLGNLLLFNRFIRGAVAIQCLSELELRETDFGKRKFVGTNGITIPEKYKETFRKEGARTVYIGRLDVHVKGLDLLLEAVRMSADFLREKQCCLDIYGPVFHSWYANVERMIRDNRVEDIVTLHHEITGQEKECALLDGDLFIQTSRHEGMPLGVLEAMAYGLPCILTEGTNLRGFSEEKNAGWGAENTAASIADAIVRAVEDREIWEKKSWNARAAVQREFDWNIVARDVVDVYRELLKEVRAWECILS